MQYNMNLMYTVGQLQTITMIPLDILIQVVKHLLKVQLLRSEGEADKLTVDTKLNLYLGFENKKQRIKIAAPLNLEAKKKQDHTDGYVGRDRQLIIEAATVRIVKAQKTLKHEVLVAEICKETGLRFKADLRLIKNTIELLIEREYIARVKGMSRTYVYVA